MSRLTEELIRRKAEHHDGILADLEEVSLHQLELERIEVVGTLCRKLKILYLQNNIIPKIENLHHLKQLQYLNLALNNVTKIEGLRCVSQSVLNEGFVSATTFVLPPHYRPYTAVHATLLARRSSCEFLNKLDLTVNFIDVDTLEESVDHLAGLLHLRELYLMGNPCLEWEGARPFIVANVPQLAHLDGKEINRTERIEACQRVAALRAELRALANAKRLEKGHAAVEYARGATDEADDENAAEAWTPENRVKMVREMAERKSEQEARRRDREPAKRDLEKEHAEAVAAVRAKEEEGGVRQCNEGRWQFSLDDEDGKGNMELRLQLSRYLDSSLISAEVHPTFVSVVIKGRTFRLTLPEEVRSGESVCKRSQTTGELLVLMPKVRKNDTLRALRREEKIAGAAAGAAAAATRSGGGSGSSGTGEAGVGSRSGARHPSEPSAGAGASGAGRPGKLGEELLSAALAASAGAGSTVTSPPASQAGAVSVGGIVRSSAPSASGSAAALPDGMGGSMLFRAAESRRTGPGSAGAEGAGGAGRGASATAAAAAVGSSLGDADDDLPPLI
jgi:protein TilB